MKNKWLVGLLSALMVVSLAFGVAACKNDKGKDDDASIAERAIALVRDTYIDDAAETFADYEVNGQFRIGSNTYKVDWTVTSEVEGYESYVSVGEMDADTTMVPVHISLENTVRVDYTLTASVTVGKVTTHVDFAHVIPLTYTVKQAQELAASLSSQQYYKENDSVVAIAVRGIVTERGHWTNAHSNIQGAYIKDAEDNTATCQLYGLDMDGKYLNEHGDLVTDAEIIVAGALQKYYNDIELTFYNSASIDCVTVAYTLPETTDQERVNRAKAALEFYPTVLATPGAEKTLATTLERASLTWTVETGTEYASVVNGKLKTADALPATKQPVTLKATIKSGSVEDSKTFELQALAITDKTGTKSEPLTVAEAQDVLHSIDASDYSDEMAYVKGYVISASWDSNNGNRWKNVYLADEANESNQENQLLVYRLTVDGTVLAGQNSLEAGDLITVYGYLYNYYGEYEVSAKSSNGVQVYCVYTDNENAGGQEEPEEPTGAFTPVEETPVAGNYYIAMQASGKWYYLTGEATSDKEYYLAVTTSPLGAAEFTIETTEGGYTIKVGEKWLVIKKNGTYVNSLYVDTDDTSCVWVWEAEQKTFSVTVNSTKYFLGSHDTYLSNMSAGMYSYLTGDKASTQWPARIGTLEEPTDADKAEFVLNSLKLDRTSFSATENDIALPTENSYEATVTWGVQGGTSEYVTVTDNKLSITNLPTEGDGETVTLTVSVTVGTSDAKTKTFEITILPSGTVAKGTAENPYTVDELKTLKVSTDSTSNDDNYYKVNGVVTPIYVQGIITVVGELDGTYGIKDYFFATTAGDTENDIKFKANWGDVASDTKFRVGDTVVVYGYFEYYNNEYQISQWYEGSTGHFPLLKSHTPKQLTDEEKAQEVLDSLKLGKTVFNEVDETGFELPTSNEYEATVTWSVKEGNADEYVEISGANRLLVKKLPTGGDVTITLKVTVKVNTTEVTKEDITIKLIPSVSQDDLTTASVGIEAYAASHDWVLDQKYGEVKLDNNIKATTKTGNNNGKYYNHSGTNAKEWRLFSSESGVLTITADNEATIYSVKITYTPGSNGDHLTYNGEQVDSDEVVVVNAVSAEFTVAVGKAFVTAIEVKYTGGAEWTNEAKITEALAEIDITATDLTADLPLPKTTVPGVTLTWSVTAGATAAEVQGSADTGYTLHVTRGETDTSVTLKVSASCGEAAAQEKSFDKLVVKAQPAEGSAKTLDLDLTTNFSTYAKSWNNSYSSRDVSLDAIQSNCDVSGTVNFSNACKQGSTISNAPVMRTKEASKSDYVTVKLTGTESITSVSFVLKAWSAKDTFTNITIEYSANGSTWIKIGEDFIHDSATAIDETDGLTLKAEGIPSDVKSVRLNIVSSAKEKRVGIMSISLGVNS